MEDDKDGKKGFTLIHVPNYEQIVHYGKNY